MAKMSWKRGRTLGKGGFGFVSLASTAASDFHDQTLDGVHLPPLIAVKSCVFSRSDSLQEEREFLRLFQDSPHIIRCFGVSMTEEDQLVLYNLLLEYAASGSLADCLQNNYSGNGLPDDHQPAKTGKKKQKSYMSILRRPHQKRAFKRQPHIRGLIIEH
ncbi:hypothetical protein HAX54_005471 [Datura stramonium]|uniref:Protein kinase domain-containing protein n=1 Tax=Datura stramonium TaxID=4076 RepID=A0ABS8T9K1_DATST|nr:hypothetical protein [Datura stramonium]